MLERSQWGGVVLVATIYWNNWQIALWNVWGICLSITPGMLSKLGALWLGSWWRASWKIAGEIVPITMCWFGVGLAEITLSQGKGSCGLIFMHGDRSLVSLRYTIAVLCDGSFVKRPISVSRMEGA